MTLKSIACCAKSTALVLLMSILSSPCSFAAITYVDATDGPGGNTTLLDDSEWNAVDAGSIAPADDLWSQRAFANNDTIFEAGVTSDFNNGATENAPLLKTTVTGLVPGDSYEMFAYFWATTSDWRLEATLDPANIDDAGTPGDLTDDFLPVATGINFTQQAGVPDTTQAFLADPLDFANAVVVTEGSIRMYQAPLGVGVADGSGNIVVYIDEWENDSNFRAWYDGVGHDRVPEPTSMALVSLAVLGLCARRRWGD